MAALIYANKMYPNNEKIIVFVGLGIYKQEENTDFYNGLIGGASEYLTIMRSGSQDKLFKLYIDELEAANKLGLKGGDAYYINEPLNVNIGSSLDTSPENIQKLEGFANWVILKKKPELMTLIKRLTKY